MKFEIISDIKNVKMYPGQIIEYNISPFMGIKMNWVTEITHVVDKQYFVDEQRFGPYKFWHHQHKLVEVKDGVEMHDLVHYQLPFGIAGSVAHAIFVKKQLQDIFSFRYQKLETMFNM